MTLTSLVQQNFGVREMVLAMGRSASTTSRELRRNAQPAGYTCAPRVPALSSGASKALEHNKLHRGVLLDVVLHVLRERWSPEQTTLTLAHICSKGHEHRVSLEAICNCIHGQPVGEFKRELIAIQTITTQKACSPRADHGGGSGATRC